MFSGPLQKTLNSYLLVSVSGNWVGGLYWPQIRLDDQWDPEQSLRPIRWRGEDWSIYISLLQFLGFVRLKSEVKFMLGRTDHLDDKREMEKLVECIAVQGSN